MPRSKTVLARNELRRMTADGSLNRAFQLAHSIFRYRESDREIALDVVWEALRAVEVRLLAQYEADRHDPQKPSKIRWNTLQWFQLLVYCKSEKYEKQQEDKKTASLSEEDMIIRFIKHLILTAGRRNSFHISLGLSRLLYDYSAAETMAIYDLVFQDPDSSTRKADAYYRARKNKLIEELEKRFHHFVRIYQGPRVENRFQAQDDSGRFAALVVHYLSRFTPWETRCELPKHLDTWTAVRSLQSSQASQIHSLIHPVCFSKITTALKFDPPESRLMLPRFFLAKGHSDKTTPPADPSPSDLTQDETTTIRARITEEEDLRRKFTPRSLSVLADGIERARFDLTHTSVIRFDVKANVTLIELVGRNERDEVLLASHVLIQEEDEPNVSRPQTYSIVLEGGQKISLILAKAGVEDASTSVEIKYEETKVLRTVALSWRQLKHGISETRVLKSWGDIPVLTPRVALAVLAVTAGAFMLYVVLRSWSHEPQELAKQQPTPSRSKEGQIPTPGPTSSPQMNATPQAQQTTSKPEPSPNNRFRPGVTREQSGSAAKALLEVERLYVGSMGDDAFSRTVQQRVMEKLQASNQYVITQDPNDADTTVTGLARLEGKSRDEKEIEVGNVELQLVNVAGDVIWRTRKIQGTPDEIAARFMRDLLAAIETERRRQKK